MELLFLLLIRAFQNVGRPNQVSKLFLYFPGFKAKLVGVNKNFTIYIYGKQKIALTETSHEPDYEKKKNI